MKVYIAQTRFSVHQNEYFEVPEGTLFVYSDRYRFEMDINRYPAIIPLQREKLEQVKSAANGNLLEKEVDDAKIEEFYKLNEERKSVEVSIKRKLERVIRKKSKGYSHNRRNQYKYVIHKE